MIQSSRGCPFACNFCMNPGGRIVRPRTVETTLNEIGYLVNNMGAESIYFGDEIFTVKRQRAFEICEGLVERGYHKKMTLVVSNSREYNRSKNSSSHEGFKL
jgi:anaerobic magnesium-protoporphyrin IX monomethyl ester cyclase